MFIFKWFSDCDWPTWSDPHCVPTCADSAKADPDPSPGSANREVRRPFWWGKGHLKTRAAGWKEWEADAEERNGRRTSLVRPRKEEDENAAEEATGTSPLCTEQPAPSEDERRETPGRLAVSTRDEVCGLQEAERDLPPRSRRSVALAGEGLVRPQVEKVEAIRQIPLPRTKKDVQAFLAAGWKEWEADEEERNGRRTSLVRPRKEEDENAAEEATGTSPLCTEQPAPSEDKRRETPRKLAVSTRDEVCGLREAERDLPPRSRRSVALAAAWQSPE
ncbi:hypothetical protein NDU88_003321 [Pleurodeles waltl]|uniref:Uncharacterized protein n=1 Tax=Pleurodeles waltl TaxID=8319 RepID=A0AAV7LEY7_PLEWA|nr:hypothetical protein NDU88_003321 [Pleurodeles waltl]